MLENLQGYLLKLNSHQFQVGLPLRPNPNLSCLDVKLGLVLSFYGLLHHHSQTFSSKARFLPLSVTSLYEPAYLTSELNWPSDNFVNCY